MISWFKQVWHSMEAVPINNETIIIRNLSTEKEVEGFYHYENNRYFDCNGNLVTYSFVWKYEK